MSSTQPSKTASFTPPHWRSILDAHARIAPRIHRTPVLTSASLDAMVGARLFFKCENLQKTGSFKIRGATNAIFSLSGAEVAHGIVTPSSGNHGAAVACAAGWRGVPAWIVMPKNSSMAKRRAVESYGGHVTLSEPTITSRTETAARVQAETGAVLVHPYDDDRIIAGQATAGKELLEEIGDLDAVFAPVSGGGLLSGTCLGAKRHSSGGPRLRLRAGARRRRVPLARHRDAAIAGLERHDRRWLAGVAFAANLCDPARARRRNPASERGRDHRRDASSLGAHENHHRAIVRGGDRPAAEAGQR